MSHPDSKQRPEGAPDDAPDEGDDTERIGYVVDGRYCIEALLGRGGMGTVYKAEHIGIERTVAVKLLHPELTHLPDVAKRFQREARAIGRIEHPNCVDVSDSGKLEDGSLFLVMEYLEGESVGDILADHGRIEPKRALRIMQHVLRGLGHAHERHIIHRDIKPENIFVVDDPDDDSFAKILDFGIAKLVGQADKDSVKLTQAGIAFGTPVYMSPEQAVGNPIDGRADLYAATVVLYEMLSGKAPFYSDDKIEVLSMHTSRPPPPFSQTAPGAVPPEVEGLVMRGLAKRPDERFDDADAYIASIDEVLDALDAQPARMTTATPEVRSATAPVLYGDGAPRSPRASTAYPDGPGRRGLLWGLGALALVVVIAAVAALKVGGGDGSESLESASEETPSPTDQARLLLVTGDPEGALRVLEAEKDATADDPLAQLQMGHAYTALERPRDGLRAYERAITLDSTVVEAPGLRTNLQALLVARDSEVALDAADVLLSHLSDPVAAAHLVEQASTGQDRESRRRARELADKHGLMHRVDLVESYALDLVQGERCEDRQEAVLKLHALGDPRAIEPLQKAKYRRSSKRRYRGQNINGCLRDDALEAIKELEAARDAAAETDQ